LIQKLSREREADKTRERGSLQKSSKNQWEKKGGRGKLETRCFTKCGKNEKSTI